MPEFEWWEPKRLRVLAERGLDFRHAETILKQERLYTYHSPREGEDRRVSVGYLNERLIAVVWVRRDEVKRIISMRRAWRAEERQLGALYG